MKLKSSQLLLLHVHAAQLAVESVHGIQNCGGRLPCHSNGWNICEDETVARETVINGVT